MVVVVFIVVSPTLVIYSKSWPHKKKRNESTKYFFINQLIWTSSIFISTSYLSYKQIISTKAGKKKKERKN